MTGALVGTVAVISAFAGVINPWLLLAISVFAHMALVPLARVVKQADPE